MRDPRAQAHVVARVALDEVKRVAGIQSVNTSGGLPRVLTADAALYADTNRIEVSSASVSVGHSEIQAAGVLKGGEDPAGLHFRASLAMGELGRMLRMKSPPQGMAQASGTVRQIAGRVELNGLQLAAFGGMFAGDAALTNGRQFQVNGRLEHLDIRQAAAVFSPSRLPYDGIVSGPVEARGDTKEPAATVARANFAITPGPRGIPLTGRLNADYTGRSGEIEPGPLMARAAPQPRGPFGNPGPAARCAAGIARPARTGARKTAAGDAARRRGDVQRRGYGQAVRPAALRDICR